MDLPTKSVDKEGNIIKDIKVNIKDGLKLQKLRNEFRDEIEFNAPLIPVRPCKDVYERMTRHDCDIELENQGFANSQYDFTASIYLLTKRNDTLADEYQKIEISQETLGGNFAPYFAILVNDPAEYSGYSFLHDNNIIITDPKECKNIIEKCHKWKRFHLVPLSIVEYYEVINDFNLEKRV